MHAENLVVNECSDGHAIEDVLEFFPDADAVAALAFVVEPVDPVNLTTLVITAQEEKILLVLQFVCKQQDDRLETLLASVDVVSQKEVICIRRETSIFKQSEQVHELTVDIA